MVIEIRTVGERIKHFRRRCGFSMEELGERLGVSRQTVYRYENGAIENIPRAKLRHMADIFDVTEGALLGFEGLESSPAAQAGAMVPMLGEIACGEPIYADEERGSFVLADAKMGADFCLKAKGDSMVNARIFDGDILFVRKQESVDDGEIAVVLIDDEATVKRVYFNRKDGILTLMPENPIYKPMRYMGRELDRVRILGKVVSGQYKI